MSFSKETKTELCKTKIHNKEEETAMVYGMVLFSRTFSASSLSLTTECQPVARTFSEMLSSLTGTIVELEINLTRRGGENRIFSLSVPDKNECAKIYDFFGHSPKQLNLRINRANIDNDDCMAFFLRGAFLSCGNVTNPEKDYHLEFVVPHKNLASDLEKIISEIDEINTEPHIVNRKGSYIVYIKGSENIADMLTYMGAPMASLTIMQKKMLKSVRNNINRKINSETANINKTATASAKQLYAINIIKEKRGLNYLPDDLKALAIIRLENPEYNLRELGAALTPPISRSGVNHRLQRIMNIAEELSEK